MEFHRNTGLRPPVVHMSFSTLAAEAASEVKKKKKSLFRKAARFVLLVS